MTKISSREIIDVVEYTDDKIIIVEKIPEIDLTRYKVNYFIYNLKSGEKEVITKSAYLLKKFGSAYQTICESLPGYVQSDTHILKDKSVFVIFPNGECGLFDHNGKIQWNKELKYKESPVTSLAADGNYIWCVCKDENCVIRYFCDNFQVDLRIGSKDSNTFDSPCFVSADNENVYVCCASRLRAINKRDFTVSDIGGFNDNLRRFYRFGRYTLLCTTDGAYIAEDE